MNRKEKKILVTGGTGMLGSYLLVELTNSKQNVRATYRSEEKKAITRKIFEQYSDQPEQNFAKIEWQKANLMCLFDVERVFKNVDVVYHAAAQISFDPKLKGQLIKNNMETTANVVNAALTAGNVRFCHVSSIAALGNPNAENIISEEEKTPSKNKSGYSVSKFYAELEVWRGIAEGLNAVIINPSVIIGVGDWQNGSPSFFSAVARGMKYYTDGSTGFVDVRDVVKLMVKLTKSEIIGERFIINAENVDYQHFFSKIAVALNVPPPTKKASTLILNFAWRAEWVRAKIMQQPPRITRETSRSAAGKSYYSNSKITKLFEFKFIPISQSIREVAIEYLRSHR